jgi:hypothetical protein
MLQIHLLLNVAFVFYSFAYTVFYKVMFQADIFVPIHTNTNFNSTGTRMKIILLDYEFVAIYIVSSIYIPLIPVFAVFLTSKMVYAKKFFLLSLMYNAYVNVR